MSRSPETEKMERVFFVEGGQAGIRVLFQTRILLLTGLSEIWMGKPKRTSLAENCYLCPCKRFWSESKSSCWKIAIGKLTSIYLPSQCYTLKKTLTYYITQIYIPNRDRRVSKNVVVSNQRCAQNNLGSLKINTHVQTLLQTYQF